MKPISIALAYGKQSVTIEFPSANLTQVLKPNPVSAEPDDDTLVSQSLKNPISSERLARIVRPGEKIAIITSDITRPMPTQEVLPHVLQELSLAGVDDRDVTIVFALGNHRPHSKNEMISLVGQDIFDRFRCVDSNGKMVHLGKTALGTPVDIFETVAEADRRICLGNIEYHYFAGYSGGAKAIMPGVSTREAIQANHSRMVDPSAVAGKLEGNPVRDDIDSVLSFISIDFIVNVVLDERKRIIHCVSGHPIEAHREGCRFLDHIYGVKISQKADIVVVSPGGHPKDINLYQAQKALDNAKHAVREGGSILWVASAIEGLGEKTFEHWMLNHKHPNDMIDRIRSEFVLGGHKAAAIAMVLQNAAIYLYSSLQPEFVRSIHLNPVTDPQKQLDELIREYGEECSIIVMPFGGSTLPIQKNKKME